jgi:hypothetical protein
MNLETKKIETTLAGRKITVEVEKRSGTTETFWLYLLLNNELIAVITATEDYFTYEIYQQNIKR